MPKDEYPYSRVVRRLSGRDEIEKLLGIPDTKLEQEHKTYEEKISVGEPPEEIGIQIKFSRDNPTRLHTKTPQDLDKVYRHIIMNV
jgi:hypothetical protein